MNGPFEGPSQTHALWAWSISPRFLYATSPADGPMARASQPATADHLLKSLLVLTAVLCVS